MTSIEMAESTKEVPAAANTTTITLEKGSTPETSTTISPYSVFTTVEKWTIVSMISYAAWFSTVTSFIYYPAIHQLSEYFSVSVDKINLTVTSYLAVATVAPTLVGDAADVLGRRPVYILVLSFYIGANIAIALVKKYGALVGLRVVQALAISGEVHLLIRQAVSGEDGTTDMLTVESIRYHISRIRCNRRRMLSSRKGFFCQSRIFCVGQSPILLTSRPRLTCILRAQRLNCTESGPHPGRSTQLCRGLDMDILVSLHRGIHMPLHHDSLPSRNSKKHSRRWFYQTVEEALTVTISNNNVPLAGGLG